MSTFRVIIAGGREFTNAKLMQTVCDPLFQDLIQRGFDVEIVSGRARGADALGEQYALSRNIKVAYFPANWSKLGKRAGYVRNAEMADYASEHATGGLIAFWDGQSRGTKSMIDLGHKKGLDVRIINY